MDEMLLKIYQSQVKSQCEFALMAAHDLNAALAAQQAAFNSLATSEAGNAQQDAMQQANALSNRIWFSLNAFLNAVANVSKLLWPNPNRKTARDFPNRGRELRESLGVAEDSPLQHRTVRNHFEHVDERYEKWWLESERHNIAIRTIGPLEESIAGLEQKELFEQFDPDRLVAAFQGDLFELQPIADEILSLYETVCGVERANKW